MLNSISLIGRMVRDPEYKTTAAGVGFCNFTIAVDDDFKDADGNKATDFVDCTAWRQTAEYICKYQSKGSLVAAKGRLKSRKWTDKDGNKRTSWFVAAENAYGVGGRQENQTGSSYGGGGYGGYSQPQAAIGHHAPIAPGNDYPELTDSDEQLPF